MDFKGHVGMNNGGRCHPLTILDDHSRYNILLLALANERGESVQAALVQAFTQYGLPERINIDNGAPWARRGGLADTLGHPPELQPSLPPADQRQG